MHEVHEDKFVQVAHLTEQFQHCELIPLSNVEPGQAQKLDKLREGEDDMQTSQLDELEQLQQVRLHV